VSPPFVPDRRRNLKDLDNDWGFTGFRIPGVTISPFTRGGRVSHMPVTHESILKLISYKFGFGHLNERHRFASNIGRSFNFRRPNFDFPDGLPDPATVVATPCSLQAQGAERAKPHDLVELQTSGLLDRLGYDVPNATLDQIFRYPDTVKKGLEEGNRKGAAALGG